MIVVSKEVPRELGFGVGGIIGREKGQRGRVGLKG